MDYLDAGTHKEIIAKLDYPAPKCLDCQGQMAKFDFQKEFKIPYLECAVYKTLIRLRKRRFRCNVCGKNGCRRDFLSSKRTTKFQRSSTRKLLKN
ncbi:transposase [Streptococcus thermophilus]|nr:IS1167, transposase, ISL3 family, truncated [Streptococcus thermophilus LMG 18311]CAD0125119.1 transposase [Streptococcus thermophilus]CAD0133490.1 transposase [Streptococcus thermophilus]CAD0135570.1 transposase [Streptococcus thermophilus]CAD0181098.1 transposase [Streptococcus thermophilus]